MPNDSRPTALVTGAGRGLGLALVDALLARGAARVYATARRPEDLSRLAERGAIPLSLDLTRPAEIRAAAAGAGAVDLLVNNAGAAAFSPLLSAPRAGIEREIATNVLGTLDLIRAVVPAMPAGGTVVNVLSLLSLAATPAMAGYSASKAAAHSMTQALRPALAERGIRVVGVYPGAIDTDMLAGVDMAKADPRDVAEAILAGVADGEEDVFPDPMAVEMGRLWRADPKAFERAFATLAP
ncbi:MAG: SDR family NAD(P)-dependent oxidoreductase [Thermoleophilia bacterium]|nr:SDR family NAD(P)-dependent oxidoreductase [Thermoleophilia bacterium]